MKPGLWKNEEATFGVIQNIKSLCYPYETDGKRQRDARYGEVEEAILDRDIYMLLRLPSVRFDHQNQFKKAILTLNVGKVVKKQISKGTKGNRIQRCFLI